MSRAICSAVAVVAAREVPSGDRTSTLNCDWSSVGRKFFPTNMKSGTMLQTVRKQKAMTVFLWAMDQRSMAV